MDTTSMWMIVRQLVQWPRRKCLTMLADRAYRVCFLLMAFTRYASGHTGGLLNELRLIRWRLWSCLRLVRLRIFQLVVLLLIALSPSTKADETTLTWTPPDENTDGSQLTDLDAFKIYWGTTPGVYTDTIRINCGSDAACRLPANTQYVQTFPDDGLTYYFVSTAFKATGVESGLSNIATKTMPDDGTPIVLGPVENLVITTTPVTLFPPIDFPDGENQ